METCALVRRGQRPSWRRGGGMNRTFDFYEYAGIIIPGAVFVMALVSTLDFVFTKLVLWLFGG